MPTYTVHSALSTSEATVRPELAARITAEHRRHTGAPASFVQVLFRELDANGHFVGGVAAPAGSVHVHGQIRAGRTPAVRHALITALRDAVVEVAQVPAELVWVYLSELPPESMLEFGRVLPAPGAEDAWLAALPEPLRRRLAALDERPSTAD